MSNSGTGSWEDYTPERLAWARQILKMDPPPTVAEEPDEQDEQDEQDN